MIATIIAYGSALFFLVTGLLGLFSVASRPIGNGSDGPTLLISGIFVFIAWFIAHLAGI